MKKTLLLVVFAMTVLFGQSSPTDRGYAVVTLPAGKSLAGDGEGGFCYITEESDPSISHWKSGQVVETFVRESELGGVKFDSAFPIGLNGEMEKKKILCFPDAAWFLAYSVKVARYEVAGLFSGKTKLLSPLQTIKIRPVGQLTESDKMFVGGLYLERSAGRDFMISWVSDKGEWSDVRSGVLELKQPLSQTFSLLDSKEILAQFRAFGLSCASGTGYWGTEAKSSQDTSTSLVYFSRTGKIAVVKGVNAKVDDIPVACDAAGVVMPYPDGGTVKISRWNESNPELEVPLMVGNSFAGYRLTKITSLVVSDDGIYFIAETDKGVGIFRLPPKSAVPELVKAPGETPFGVPQTLVPSGYAVGVHQLEGGTKPSNFSFTRGTVPPPPPPPPSPEISGIANGASFDLSQPLAPGTIFSLFGKNLGTAESARTWPLPRKLGGTKVTICGVDAPLFASTGPMTRLEGGQLWQINGVVPNIASAPTCEIAVSVDQKAPLQALAAKSSVKISSKPEETLALFIFTGSQPNGSQSQFPIITNTAGQLIAPPGVSIPGTDPAMFTQARACEVVTLWATGGGGTFPLVADGNPAPSTPLATTLVNPAVQIYGSDADVLFAGLAPGFAGLNQINVRVPCEATSGEQWLWFGRPDSTLGKTYKISIQ